MANTTADIEQLLTELVRITTNIAALVNATNTNASDGSDSLTSNANRLSLSATIIAVAAFLIASLQAVLEYSSSGESARRNAVDKRFIMSSIHLDVDSIPGSLDVPPQIIDLVALGKVVVYLGCDSVNISVQNRNFEAVGKFGSITTEELIGFGYGINMPRILLKVQKGDSNMYPSDIYKSVNMMSDTNAQAASTRWQSSVTPVFKGTKFPSILVTLAVAVFPCAVNGFPARSLLQPFLVQSRQISQAIYGQCEKPFPNVPNDHITNRRDLNLHEIIRKELTMSVILDASTTSIWTRDAAERVKQDFSAELDLLLVKERMPKSALGEGLFRQWRMILAPIANLIKSFDPHSLAQSFREKVRLSEYKYLIHAGGDAPLEILNVHIVLVDIRIYHVLSIMHETWAPQMQFAKHENLVEEQGYFRGLLSPRGTFIFHVRAAILKSLSDASLVRSRLFDNFGRALLSEINTFTATTEYEKRTREVGDLLAFRIVLYAACLLIVPDTSDILETQLSVGRRGFVLPMI
ncbi:hypothetical protein FHL15_002878 [Xylaria flabelliformis]|uniref:Uncharacterized protein n=1 Tax=Xylaria flabelliformis TaxID=2512241 RepID=A0A553I7K3_9PEZI|nr:hypothetical protein FHL15_002878 [Xylaria flabelliformis]